MPSNQKIVKKKPKPAAKKVQTPGAPKGPTAADLEKEIEFAETRMAELSDILGMSETYADADKASAALTEYNELSTKIEQLYADWEAIVESS